MTTVNGNCQSGEISVPLKQMKPRTGKPFWLWLNLISLDAPLVALAWQDLLARCYPSNLRSSARLVLGLTVWAIYLADRLVDTRGPAVPLKTARHRFHRENHAHLIILLLTVLAVDGGVALSRLPPDLLLRGFVLAVSVAAYLAFFAWRQTGAGQWKQVCAAVLFTSGLFLSVDRLRGYRADLPVLAWPAAAFCALCLGNLMLIERWEQARETSTILASMAALSLTSALLGHSRWYAAVALSAAGLVVLDLLGTHLPGSARRVLADAALLTPLLLR